MFNKIISTNIEGLIIIEPKIFSDQRGYFFESYNEALYHKYSIFSKFVQDNESYSRYGTIRGMHFQKNEYAQAKLVRVVKGKVLDVALDLRKGPSFGKYFSIELSSENKKQLYIPRGFAHGFATLSDEVILQYKCDNYYNKDSEDGIYYADEELKIKWGVSKEIINTNQRDSNFQTLAEYRRNVI